MRLVMFVAFCIAAMAIPCRAEPHATDNLAQRLTSTNTVERRRAAIVLMTDSPEKVPDETIRELLRTALSSKDRVVQEAGAVAAHRVAFAHKPLEYLNRGIKPPVQMNTDLRLRKLLEDTLKTGTDTAKESASQAIMLAYRPWVGLESSVVQLFNHEPSAPVRGHLIQMAVWGDWKSDDMKKILFTSLRDGDLFVQQQGVIAIGVLRPQGGIPRLLSLYIVASPVVQESVVVAIGKYRTGGSESKDDIKNGLNVVGELRSLLTLPEREFEHMKFSK